MSEHSGIRADLAPTGTLRASINLGNPVLAQGDSASPCGVTVDIAREVAARLGVPVEFLCFDAARKSFDADRDGILSDAEAQPAAQRFREIADGDGDGRVTTYEYDRAREFVIARY